MNSAELDECYEFVKKLVLDCGEVLKTGFKNPGTVTTKEGAHDLGLFVKFIRLTTPKQILSLSVTFYDGEIEKILINGIKEKYPNHK